MLVKICHSVSNFMRIHLPKVPAEEKPFRPLSMCAPLMSARAEQVKYTKNFLGECQISL